MVTSGIFGGFERIYRRLESGYRGVISWALKNRVVVLLAGVLGLAAIFGLSYFKLGADFIPGTDQGQIAINIELPPGASLDATESVVEDAEKSIASEPDVAATSSSVGQIQGGFGSIPQEGMQFGQITVRLKEKGGLAARIFGARSSIRTRSDEQIAAMFRDSLRDVASRHGAQISTSAIRSVSAGAAPVELQIRGTDLAGLAAFARQLKDRLAALPGVLSPATSIREGKPELRATIDHVRASNHNVSAAAAGAILHDSIAGNTDSDLNESGTATPIRVRAAGNERKRTGDVGNLLVGTDSGGSAVLLSDIANMSMEAGPANIERQNGKRMITVTANLSAETALSSIQREMNRAINEIPHAGWESDMGWGRGAIKRKRSSLCDSAYPGYYTCLPCNGCAVQQHGHTVCYYVYTSYGPNRRSWRSRSHGRAHVACVRHRHYHACRADGPKRNIACRLYKHAPQARPGANQRNHRGGRNPFTTDTDDHSRDNRRNAADCHEIWARIRDPRTYGHRSHRRPSRLLDAYSGGNSSTLQYV